MSTKSPHKSVKKASQVRASYKSVKQERPTEVSIKRV